MVVHDGEVIHKLTTRNYPNPFEDKINIAVSIPVESHVLLDVYDTKGQRLCILLDKVMPAGNHVVTWHSDAYGAGMFIYRVSSNGTVLTERMMKKK
jgi:endoglucanase